MNVKEPTPCFCPDSLPRCWLLASAVAERLVTGPAVKEKVVKRCGFCAALAPARRPSLANFCCTVLGEVQYVAMRTSDALHAEDILALLHLASNESVLLVLHDPLAAHVALTVAVTLVTHKRHHVQ